MNNNNITLQIIDGIYDIKPILKPDLSLLEITLLSFIVIILFSLSLYFFWQFFYSQKVAAIRKVKKLETRHLNKEIDTHNTIYEICNILRVGLNIKNVNTQILLPPKIASTKVKWDTFIEEIDRLRYKDNPASDFDIEQLFEKSLYWLKVWP